MRLVLVFWDDAVTDTGWRERRDFVVPDMACVSVGWLVHQSKKALTLASTKDAKANENMNNLITIPAKWISRIVDVAEV